MRSRWSPVVFDPAHVIAAEEVRLLLDAARWAPSWGNSQPWHFLVCERGTSLHTALVSTLSRGNTGWVPNASVVFVGAVRTAASDGAEPSPYGSYDAGQAAAHLTLQARSMGLHAHQFAGFDHEAMAERAGVPDGFTLLAGIAVGRHGQPDVVDEATAAKEQRTRVRREVEEFAFTGAWGRSWTGEQA